MANEPAFDIAAAHKFFAAHCFNAAWDLIDKAERTAEENEWMVNLCCASLWHWSQRADCTDRHLSIGYWQASRIHTLLGDASSARHCAELSLKHSREDEPFYRGYAFEALARAESLAGNLEQMNAHLHEAHRLAEQVTGADDKQMLLDDLSNIH